MQTGILAPVPKLARYLSFNLSAPEAAAAVRDVLPELADGERTVVGLGHSLLSALGVGIPGLTVFAARAVRGIEVPSTPAALWCWLRGEDRGELYQRTRQLERALAPALALDDVVDAFCYRTSLDLSGYEDGTENPTGAEAEAAALVSGSGAGLDGSSFVAALQWVHDLDALDDLSAAQRDDIIGRHQSDNEEFDEAPPSAHVKRTAQESFEPPAFVLRRSMPWVDGMAAGLYFTAFGHSLAAFEALFNRMLGEEDGITDALFSFTRPVSGAYFWCPPARAGKLDLRALQA